MTGQGPVVPPGTRKTRCEVGRGIARRPRDRRAKVHAQGDRAATGLAVVHLALDQEGLHAILRDSGRESPGLGLSEAACGRSEDQLDLSNCRVM